MALIRLLLCVLFLSFSLYAEEPPKPAPADKPAKEEKALDAAELATLAESASPYSKFAASIIRELKKQKPTIDKDQSIHIKGEESEEVWKIGPPPDDPDTSLFLRVEMKLKDKDAFTVDADAQIQALSQIWAQLFNGPLADKELPAVQKSMAEALGNLKKATFRITASSDWILGDGLKFQCTIGKGNVAAQVMPSWSVEARWQKPHSPDAMLTNEIVKRVRVEK